MKKIILTLIFVLCCIAGRGQTESTPTTGVNPQELNEKWGKFTQLSEKKQYSQAIEEGIRVSVLFTQNRQYKEAFATCRQMDALILSAEQESKQAAPALRFAVSKERLRMYIRLKNAAQCETQLSQMKIYAEQSQSAELQEELLFAEADYYQAFGMAGKSLECYRRLLRMRIAGKDEKETEKCYQDMLALAEKNNNAPLASAMRQLHTAWQDSIKGAKAARELSLLQEKYDASQKEMQEKEDRIGTDLIVIVALCVLSGALAAALLFLGALLMKHIRRTKALKHSLQIANENNEQKSRFIGNISAQIQPSLEAVAHARSEQVQQEHISALTQLMEDIQTYMALEETRETHYPLKEVNIKTLCEEIMDKAKADFPAEVEAVVNVPRMNVKTHAGELERILLYLLKSAAMHTTSGKITLEFKKRSAHTHQFILTDTGTGIPADIRIDLFKPFAQMHDLTKGNGLGLPTCSLIAYKLGGTLKLDEEYKKGTRFVLELHA